MAANERCKFTRPQPSSLFGISRVPISSAPRINNDFTKAPWGSGRCATSIRYSRMSADAPAAFGAAIDVPEYSKYH